MYISVDMDSLTFLHKHDSFNMIMDLDFIRNKHKVTNVGTLKDYRQFDQYTDMQLSTLHKNMTGMLPTVFGNQLRMMLLVLAERFPETECSFVNVHAQASYIERINDAGVAGFYYAHGAMVPSKAQPALFPKLSLTADDGPNAIRKLAARAASFVPHTSSIPLATPNSTQATRPSAPQQRPRSGVCAQIWTELDALYAVDSVIPDRGTVQALAAKHGWNKNTASVQSAAWKKSKSTLEVG